MSPRFHYTPTTPDAGSIGDLMLRRGQIAGNRARTIADIEAQAAMARGQIWGGTVANIAGSVGDLISGYARDKAEAPARALEHATKVADLRLKETQIAEAGQKADERAKMTRQDTAFAGLFEMYPDGNIPPKELSAIYGPQKGLTIANALTEWQNLRAGKVADLKKTAVSIGAGLKALKSPALQAAFWPQVKQAAVAAQIPGADQFPDDYSPEVADFIIAFGKGELPEAPELMNVPPGGAVLDPVTMEPVFTNPREVTPPNPTDASLAAAAAAGDPQAKEALRLLQEQRSAGQQERAGYFTMQPIYDAQGRPVGAMKLNARTGETEFVQPSEMGGVTARPPGNLGQRTIEQEGTLDALGRLKEMFDQGAKEDIGPAEGRARKAGQQVPGGAFVTERFANFDAATRAFQNSMIKAITGAQMSEPEAQRIMGQIPNVTDNAMVWQAKYDQSVKNLEDLERRTREDRGSAPNAATQKVGDMKTFPNGKKGRWDGIGWELVP